MIERMGAMPIPPPIKNKSLPCQLAHGKALPRGARTPTLSPTDSLCKTLVTSPTRMTENCKKSFCDGGLLITKVASPTPNTES